MAAIRALEWQTREFWIARIGGYFRVEHSPQLGLPDRAGFVAINGETLVGFVAGHLTTRFGCDGELQWINVLAEHRGKGIADALMHTVLDWFRQQNAFRVCVNVEPDNAAARALYARHGAVPLSQYWMIWEDQRQGKLFSE